MLCLAVCRYYCGVCSRAFDMQDALDEHTRKAHGHSYDQHHDHDHDHDHDHNHDHGHDVSRQSDHSGLLAGAGWEDDTDSPLDADSDFFHVADVDHAVDHYRRHRVEGRGADGDFKLDDDD
jgi:hypothetical protein